MKDLNKLSIKSGENDEPLILLDGVPLKGIVKFSLEDRISEDLGKTFTVNLSLIVQAETFA